MPYANPGESSLNEDLVYTTFFFSEYSVVGYLSLYF